jgi:DNA-binding transcriptional MocR family regulator
MRMDALMQASLHVRPKLLYLVSNFSNPTGATWSRERRVELLRWAVAHGVLVVEDDPYGQLWYEQAPPPSLLALADEVPGAKAWCGYMSSLSKMVSGGLRLGWLVMPAPVIDVCVRLKQAMDLQTSSFAQEVAAQYLALGRLQHYLPGVRQLYRQRCEALANALHKELAGRIEFDMPNGGMFIWARLSGGLDATALLPHALAQGLAFVPGAAFYAQQADASRIRLSFSNLEPTLARTAVQRLSRALEQLQPLETA